MRQGQRNGDRVMLQRTGVKSMRGTMGFWNTPPLVPLGKAFANYGTLLLELLLTLSMHRCRKASEGETHECVGG